MEETEQRTCEPEDRIDTTQDEQQKESRQKKEAHLQGPEGLVRVPEVTAREEKGDEAEKVVQQVTAENIPKSAGDINLLIQKAQRTTSRVSLKKPTRHVT